MLPELTQKTSLYNLLFRIDEDLAEEVKKKGCPYCGGPLHYGNYPRKPRGGPDDIPDELQVRHSLCCGQKGCRKRQKPPSVRFMGQKVYWACVILIVMVLRQNRPNGKSASELQRMFGISYQTIVRWIQYFRDEFPQSNWWQRLRGRVDSTISNSGLPGNLLNCFIKSNNSHEKGLVECLRFLASGQG